MAVDYSKFEKIVDSDEEDYDSYLSSRYGVSSDYIPPYQRPDFVEDAEAQEVQAEWQASGGDTSITGTPKVGGDESAGSSMAVADGARRFGRCFVGLRLVQIVCWFLPVTSFVQVLLPGAYGSLSSVEATVYPIVCIIVGWIGLLDVALALLSFGLVPAAAATFPRLSAFVTIGKTLATSGIKRWLLAWSFLSYEARWTSPGAVPLGRKLRLITGLSVSAAWGVRSGWRYAKEILVARELLQECKVAGPGHAFGKLGTLGERPLLLVEAFSEFVCLLTHGAMIPSGTTFVGENVSRFALVVLLGAILVVCNGFALLAIQSPSDAIVEKKQS